MVSSSLILQTSFDGLSRHSQGKVRDIYSFADDPTALLIDVDFAEGPPPGELPVPESAAAEALTLARCFRAVRSYSEMVDEKVGRVRATVTSVLAGSCFAFK